MKQAIIENAKKMMEVNKKVLKSLHNTFGFAFESETSNVKIFEIKLPATLNKIIKDCKLSSDDFNVLLIQDKWDEKEFRTIMFNDKAEFNIDGFYTDWNRALSNYYKKSDFNNDRKNADLQCFLITTKNDEMPFTINDLKQYRQINIMKEKSNVLSANYKNNVRCLNRIKYENKDIRTFYCSTNKSVAYGVWNARLIGYNCSFDIDYSTHNCLKTVNSINDLFDKSGYNVKVKRDDLKYKARELKSERELKQLQKMDYSEENRKIETRIFNAKNTLIERLKNIDFENEKYKKILASLKRLQSLYQDFKNHEEMLVNAMNDNKEYHYHNYGSIKDVEQVIKLNNETIDLILELKFEY